MDFKIEPATIQLKPGSVVFDVTNAGPTPHNFTIRNGSGASFAATAELKRQTGEQLPAELTAGEYTYFCALPGHESLGMHGTLIVGP
jgi:plastocyanin